MDPDFPQLTLDLSPPKPSIPSFLIQFLVTDLIRNSDDLIRVNYYIDGLEDELKKIQAFQRELPLSVFLLNDVITKLKEAAAKKNEGEEFKSGKLNKSLVANSGFNDFDKKNWMSSAQLWSPTSDEDEDEAPRRCEDRGVILSFAEVTDDHVPGLSLVPPGLNSLARDEPGSSKGKAGASFSGSALYTTADKMNKPGIKLPYQTARKRRRCWSPELHRQFVDALERLGGSQVATPKQIRDLMQVDGLTNDEVKSHLQKYRLHVRKLPSANTTTQVLSDIAVESRDELELGCSTMDLQNSSSPKGPLHLGRSKKCNSPSLDEDDEEKSDGHSWKAHNHL